ncbi:MAG: ABC transporter permease [Proteobacteria bacterium]|nr:ABC transporter permease [Candidatus Dependentiae bacterium]MBU4582442.1 ABC transporter permease [Pseudomonadota bacterium]MCG2738922.1 ABC transporter permease [Syntrophaceae bacterium]
MGNLFKIAIRNLLRYKRRTLLTASLITLGVVFVLVFVSVSGSFKNMMIGQVTDSMIGHMQVHRKGFVASIETLPLNLNLKGGAIGQLEKILNEQPEIDAYSPRVKFGGMFSNFTETSSIRLTAIYPEKEFKAVPLLPGRVTDGSKELKPGGILIPELLARGMKVKPGDMVVIVATNADGSVNGKQFTVTGVLESATGPGGRDGYIHMDDAIEVLRMEGKQVSEYAVRLKDFGKLAAFGVKLDGLLAKELNQQGKPIFELHTWEKLSPFFNIARMIDLMTFFIKLMLIAIVLISIMNVMIMAVYERIREIGTIAAIGTLPGKILNMFLIEGFCMGVGGALIGDIVGIALVYILNLLKITYNFGQQKGIILQTAVSPADVLVISATVIIVSVIASLQPAFKASRMEPIKALRHT